MADSARFKLLVHDESGPREFELGPDPAVIGRSPENTIQINHGSISRRHCEVRFPPEGVEFRDLDSANGTWVNGERITKCKCGRPIYFIKTRTGKKMPVDYESRETHFAHCPDAGEFRKERRK